nr:Chain B, Beta-catenin-like protein hmp-2 [Caenorhabditis elegans]
GGIQTSAAEATNSTTSIVEMMQMPTQQLKQSVMDLLTYEGSNDMSGLS